MPQSDCAIHEMAADEGVFSGQLDKAPPRGTQVVRTQSSLVLEWSKSHTPPCQGNVCAHAACLSLCCAACPHRHATSCMALLCLKVALLGCRSAVPAPELCHCPGTAHSPALPIHLQAGGGTLWARQVLHTTRASVRSS